jgi:hypothetical protein
MPQDQVLLAILGVGGLATLVLVATIALLARSRRRSRLAGTGTGEHRQGPWDQTSPLY